MPPKKKKVAKKDVKSMFINLDAVLDQVGKDKGIPKEILIEVIENAMLTAAKKKLGYALDLEAHYNEDEGEIELFQFKTVVEEVEDELIEVTLPEARELDPEIEMGDSLGEKIDSYQFGRIAAQTAKQVIVQKMRHAERDIIFEEYRDRVGELITGIVRRFERGNLIIDLGRTEAVIPYRESIPGEVYRPNDRVQALFLEIDPNNRGPQVIMSRKSPKFIKALFEMEVPEISEGIVEIKAVSREVGSRAKIAVYSDDPDVDPVGACVGIKGSRVQSVVQELRGEKIDIVTWEEDPARFVCNAIAPAEVIKVVIHELNRVMEIVVPNDQLSLAIGKRGQNVRLAAQLTGWGIDVVSEEKYEEKVKEAQSKLVHYLKVDNAMASLLYNHGFKSIEDISNTEKTDFTRLPGLNPDSLGEIFEQAKKIVNDVDLYDDLEDEWEALHQKKEAEAQVFKEKKDESDDVKLVENNLEEESSEDNQSAEEGVSEA